MRVIRAKRVSLVVVERVTHPHYRHVRGSARSYLLPDRLRSFSHKRVLLYSFSHT